MIACLDTNVVAQARAAGHPFRPSLETWVNGRFTWAVATDVLIEDEEVLTRLSGAPAWRKPACLTDLSELASGNLLHVTPYSRFHFIRIDSDDDILTDCSITAGADYLVAQNHHYSELKNAGYKTQPIAPIEFIQTILPTNEP